MFFSTQFVNMRLSKIKSIFLKEILDTIRDRRTLLITIVIPVVLYPGLMIFMSEVATSQQAKMEKKTIKVAVVNIPKDSPLIKRLKAEQGIEIVTSSAPYDEVKGGGVQYVLELSPDSLALLKEGRTATVQLHYDRSNDETTANLDRILRIIDSYSQDLLNERLKEKSLSGEFVTPLDVKEVNVATKQRMGGALIGRLLPMLMVFMVLVGAMYPAIDMTAGEKERGTLETILTSPATRTEIVIGKFLTVTLIALLTGLLNLGSMMGTFAFGIFKTVAQSIQIKIPMDCMLIMIACLVPLAVFFGGVMMAIASFARSYKEAQSLVMPFYLVATLPAMVSTIPGLRLEGFWLTLPVANVTLLFKELMLGIFIPNHILIVLFSVLFLASVAIFLAIQLFGREEVLFGETSSFGLALRYSNIVPKSVPERSEALLFTIIALTLLIYAGLPLQMNNLIRGLLITELGIFLAFPVAYAAYLKLDLRKTFRLYAPSAPAILATFLMFAGIALAIGTLSYLQNRLFPVPQQMIDYMDRVMRTLYGQSFAGAFILIALLPAICEEVSFRGVVLSGMLSRSKPWNAILITTFLFAVFHLSLHRFPGVFLIGLAATYLVWKSGSIFTGMLLHMLSNGYVAFVAKYSEYDWLGVAEGRPSVWLFTAGLAVVASAVVLIKRGTTTAVA